MPLPDPAGYSPSWVTNPITAGPMSGYVNYGTPGDQWTGASADGTPIRNQTVLPQEFWPSEEEYNRTVANAARFGLTPPPRGTLDNDFTQQLGRALYEEGQRESASSFGMGSPGWAALVAMGGAAAGGAFANGGAGYGALAPGGAPAAAGGASSGLSPITVGATPLAGGVPAVTGAGFSGTGAIPALASMPGLGAGTSVAGGAGGLVGAGAGEAGAAAGGAAAGVPSWIGNYLIPGVNAGLGYLAADQASDAMTDASQAAVAEQQRQFDLTRSDLAPWLTAGQGALNNLQNPASSFAASPGYEWARNEGQRDIGNSFAARGGAASGNALKALSEFNTGLAQQDYGNWWNQQAGLAGVGQNTAVNLGQFGQNTASNVGNALMSGGNARASGVLGKYGALAGGANDAFYNYLYRRG